MQHSTTHTMATGYTFDQVMAHLLATGKVTQQGLDEAQRKLDADPAIRRARRGLGPFVVKIVHRRQQLKK